ncbi:hypothetical protein C8R44DRAFT_573383, partial [Mycena epipterygia]
PFMHWMSLGGPRGEQVRVLGLFNTGAQVGGMSKAFYDAKAARLGETRALTRHLRMANGELVAPFGQWEGTVDVGGVRIQGVFDIFNSGGSWEVLFGKPLQAELGVVHDVKADVVVANVGGRSATLRN